MEQGHTPPAELTCHLVPTQLPLSTPAGLVVLIATYMWYFHSKLASPFLTINLPRTLPKDSHPALLHMAEPQILPPGHRLEHSHATCLALSVWVHVPSLQG